MLEVGGDQPSLRAALLARGSEVAPPHVLVPVEVAGPGTGPGGTRTPAPYEVVPPGPGEQPDPADNPVDPNPDDVTPTPPPASEWETVTLPEGETLIHVARRHLGDGRRFHEILKWNGWTDSDARRLKKNQPVKIKRSEMK